MRAGLLILAVILAGLALAWALLTPPYLPSAPAPVSVRPRAPANGRVTLAPDGARKSLPATAIAKPVEARSVDASVVDSKPSEAKTAAADSAARAPADAKSDDARPTEAKPIEPQATENPPAPDVPHADPDAPAPDDSATSGTGDADSPATDSGDEASGAEEHPAETSIDPGRAADLLADWMAREDVASSAEDGADSESPGALSTFDHEEPDSDWAEPTTRQIEATLRAWLDALPAEVRAHMALIHVECRATLCQILAADDAPSSQSDRAEASQEWQQAFATLPQQPWWASLGFVDYQAMVANDPSGYLLYQAYLRREVKPAA